MDPRRLKTRFTVRFLRSLRKINSHRNIPLSRRRQMIKISANISMAAVVGPQRAWSRATLLKSRRRVVVARKKSRRIGCGAGEEEQLRELVPGGEAMDTCRLLDETAHYIKCLAAQVKVMTTILHCCST